MRSLRHRLLLVTLVCAGLTVVASGFALSALFRDHARQQFVERLTADLDQILARLEVDGQGQPTLDQTRLSDPRWTRPHSGLYWQIDAVGADGRPGLLRSRSLWDEELAAPNDMPGPGELHVHRLSNERKETLLLIERTLTAEGSRAPWRVMVAASTASLDAAAERFDTVLMASLLVLMLLLGGGAHLQVVIGLAPLKRLREALSALREGRTPRLDGRYPVELQPLVDDLNSVLDRQAATLERARAQAGNLAHALKTPLTILNQAAVAAGASVAERDELPALVLDQVRVARRHVDWHLARARAAAAAQNGTGLRTAVRPLAEGLVRVMQKIHADRRLSIGVDVDPRLAFAGESQDLQEMLGNLVDNACKAARSQVRIDATQDAGQVRLTVDDDGPGIAPDQRAQALERGRRLDETAGSGLGLAIVQELACLYGGSVELGSSPLGGLRAKLSLPAA